MLLGTLLAASVATICALIAVLVMLSSKHQLELTAVRAQSDRDRDIATKMWQLTDDDLRREHQKATQTIQK